jgi:hypothetical protein
MTRHSSALVAIALVISAVLTVTVRPAAQSQAPVFRASADAVILDVSVRSHGRPVAALTVDDFQVVDNGVPQHVDAASIESLPIDVTFVVDTSSDAESNQRVAPFINRIRDIAGLLRADDRVGVLMNNSYVIEWSPSTPIPQGGGTSIYDAFVMALLQPPTAGRRRLIIAFTEGIDLLSETNRSLVPTVAQRADSLLHVVTAPIYTMGVWNGVGLGALKVVPGADPLIEAARVTGGDVHALASDVVTSIKDVLDDFRASYLLYYSPRGVERAGWHDLHVSMKKPRKYDVRARKGYVGG